MPVISDTQAKTIAGGISSIGGVQNYGGGSGEYSQQQLKVTPGTTVSASNTASNNLLSKIGSIGKTIGSLAVSGIKVGGGFVENHIVEPLARGIKDVTYDPAMTVYHGVRTAQISSNIDHLNTQRQQATTSYQSGKMPKQDYDKTLKTISDTLSGYNKELASGQRSFAQTQADYRHLPSDIADNAMTALAVFTGGGSLAANVGLRGLGIGGETTLRAFTEKAGETGAEQLTKLAGKRGVSAFAASGGKDVLKTMIKDGANKLEQAVLKVPGVRTAFTKALTRTLQREAQQQLIGESTGQFISREAKTLATALLIKDPIVYHLNVDSGKSIYEEMTTGKYGPAVLNAGLQALQIFDGPITAVTKVLKNTGSKLRDLTYGNKSFIDTLSSQIGNGKSNQIADFVKSGEKVTSKTGKTTMNGDEIYRYAQENNLRRASDDVDVAASNALENYLRAGVDPRYLKPAQFAQDYLNHQEAVNLAKQLGERGVKGLSREAGQNLVVVRWDSQIKRGVANAIRQAGDDKQAMTQVITQFQQDSNAGWVNNPTLMTELAHIIDEAPSAEAAAKRIQSIPTALAIPKYVPKRVAADLAKLGYSVAVPEGGIRKSSYVTDYNDTRKLISNVTNEAQTVTKTTPVDIPTELKGLAKEAKNYDSVDDFVAAQKAKTVTTYKTVTKDAPVTDKLDVPQVSASRSMALGKPGVKGSSDAVYNTTDANLQQIMRSAIIAAKGTAKTAGEHEDALTSAGFSDADIKAIRDFAVKSADESGRVDSAKLQTFVEDRLNGQAGKPTTERVATTVNANVNEADARKAYELAHTEPTVTTQQQGARDLFDPAIAPQPTLNAAAGFLTKVGLSPQAAQQKAYEALSSSVAGSLDSLGVARDLGFKLDGNEVVGGQVILSKLKQWVDNQGPNKLLATVTGTFGKARPAITDIRQMTLKNIREALNDGNKGVKISESDAKDIRKAVMDGYLKTPLELRGLGDKALDYLYKANPLQKYYSRVQSALRYSYNPFFQAQEAVETSLFAGLQGGNKATVLASNGLRWGKTRAELDQTVQQLEDAQVFGSRSAGEGLFASSLAGEAAQDQTLGRLTADITRGQKRDLAGLAQDIAAKQGMGVPDMLQNNPEQLADALRIVVQYPRQGGLASPLARTLNLAFFPARYNLKVTKLAGEILAKQPAAIQFATVHSLLNLNNWLQSDEGVRWRAQNADAIQVFNWISPLNNISNLMNTLGFIGDTVAGKETQGIGALGQLGGLPFGVISQTLDGLGIININKPYSEPKTGDVIPNYIPNTMKARAATALQDLLGSVFTYPGATLGLPGKSAAIRGLVSKFIGTTGQYTIQQYTTKDSNGNIILTPLGEQQLSQGQKNLIKVLAGDTSPEAIDRLYMDDQGMPTLPPSVLPFVVGAPVATLSKTELLAAKNAQKSSTSAKVKPVAKPIGQF